MAAIIGGWLAFDGAHALVTGNYVTPSSGRHAGQLGPWSALVSGAGLDPHSTLVMCIHLLLGLATLGMTLCFVLRVSWGWYGMVTCAVLSLWYLPFGTALAAGQLVVLFQPAVRPHQLFL